ncbi:4a-hydroxytetrahydrobiopterin dehydratase [Paraconexibacter sp.]|uniref:4a-hydroxytetrahydrobiopterin dehydratase n=1 Tax=Paraconexibacter sp. TaxID=2949640 RepID=UPI00356AB93D
MARLSDTEIDGALQGRPDWRREGEELVRDRSFADFTEALAFVNAVGAIAEARNHHPDILLHGWNNVRLRISTHSEGGITAADVELADAVDGL